MHACLPAAYFWPGWRGKERRTGCLLLALDHIQQQQKRSYMAFSKLACSLNTIDCSRMDSAAASDGGVTQLKTSPPTRRPVEYFCSVIPL